MIHDYYLFDCNKMQEKKKSLKSDQNNTFKLYRKTLMQRYTQIAIRKTEENQNNEVNKPNKNVVSMLTIPAQTEDGKYIHKHKALIVNRYALERSEERETSADKGATPFQQRRIKQKAKSSKILSKILAKNNKNRQLSSSQNKWFIVKQINHKEAETSQKENENIRETEATLKESEDDYLKYPQNNNQSQEKQLINSWIFPCANDQKLQKNKKNIIKNKKVTIKELWKMRCNTQDSNLFNDSLIHNSKQLCKQKIKELILRTGGSVHKLIETKPCQIHKGASIHSKNKIKSEKQKKIVTSQTSPALKIQNCQLQSYNKLKGRNISLSYSLSQSKIIKGNEDNQKLRNKYLSHKSYRKAKYFEDNTCKQLSAWEIANDFSERQNLF